MIEEEIDCASEYAKILRRIICLELDLQGIRLGTIPCSESGEEHLRDYLESLREKLVDARKTNSDR